MSVDQRIRQAFADLEAPGPEVNAAMDPGARRRAPGPDPTPGGRRSGVAAAVATGAVLWSVLPQEAPDAPPAPSAPSPSASSGGPLAGRWTTEPLTRETVRVHLTALGYDQYADQVVAELPQRRFRLRVYVAGPGQWVLWSWGRGGKEVYYDHARPTTDGARLFLDPLGTSFEGGTTYEMQRSGTELRLTFLKTDEPTTDGVPGAVWQQAFYTVAPFDRE